MRGGRVGAGVGGGRRGKFGFRILVLSSRVLDGKVIINLQRIYIYV